MAGGERALLPWECSRAHLVAMAANKRESGGEAMARGVLVAQFRLPLLEPKGGEHRAPRVLEIAAARLGQVGEQPGSGNALATCQDAHMYMHVAHALCFMADGSACNTHMQFSRWKLKALWALSPGSRSNASILKLGSARAGSAALDNSKSAPASATAQRCQRRTQQAAATCSNQAAAGRCRRHRISSNGRDCAGKRGARRGKWSRQHGRGAYAVTGTAPLPGMAGIEWGRAESSRSGEVRTSTAQPQSHRFHRPPSAKLAGGAHVRVGAGWR